MRRLGALVAFGVGCASSVPPARPEPPLISSATARPEPPPPVPLAAASEAPVPLRLPQRDGALWNRNDALAATLHAGHLQVIRWSTCELEVGSAATGVTNSRVQLPGFALGASVECQCKLGAGVVGCTNRARELEIVRSKDGTRVWSGAPSHEDFAWQVAGSSRGLVALESPWRRIGPLPNPHLVLFDARTEKARSLELSPASERWFSVAADRALLFALPFSGRSTLEALDLASGRRHWEMEPPPGEHWVAPATNADSVVGVGGRNVTLLDAASGRTRWRVDVGHATEHAVALGRESVLVLLRRAEGDSLVALSLADGKQRWRVEMSSAEASLAAGGGRVFWRHEPTLLALDEGSGAELWRWHTMGEQRLSVPHPELLLMHGVRGELTALATGAVLTPRERRVEARVKMSSQLPGVKSDLSGIVATLVDLELAVDARGKASGSVKGRGQARLRIHAQDWLAKQNVKTPRGTFPCTAAEDTVVDLEGTTEPFTPTIELTAKACSIH